MEAIQKVLQALANGQPAAEFSTFTWVLHEVQKGATWTTVQSDGKVIETKFVPSKEKEPPPIRPNELGTLKPDALKAFAKAFLDHKVLDLKPPPANPKDGPLTPAVEVILTAGNQSKHTVRVPTTQMDQVPGLKAVAQAFLTVRGQFPK